MNLFRNALVVDRKRHRHGAGKMRNPRFFGVCWLSALHQGDWRLDTFVRSSNREDEMFVVNFNEVVSLGLPGTLRFTNDNAELENAITTARTGGQTALYDAIAKALEELQAGSRDKKVLIVVSDGGDNASARSL